MNPENLGPHVPFRHTLLWRGNPMFMEKDVPKRRACHSQMNECTNDNYLVGTTGQSWRNRNSFISTNFSQFKDKGTYRNTSKSFVAENLLTDDKLQSAATKSMYSSLKQDADKL